MMLKLNCTDEDKVSLLKTMEAYTMAFDIAAEWGLANRTTNRFKAQKGVYGKIRELIPQLNSSLVQTAIHSSCEALKSCRLERRPHRKRTAAVRYSKKSARIVFDHGFVSLSTVMGRRKINFYLPDYYRARFDGWAVVSSNISRAQRSGNFFLGVIVQKNISFSTKGGEFLGIDRGLKNIAVTSDNKFFDSRILNSIRGRFAYTRTTLQAKGTRSARRRLRKYAGREKRFIACQNHIITKQIANTPNSYFVLEDLRNIRYKDVKNGTLRNKLNSWPYCQFEKFLNYKAEEKGKRVLKVPPDKTSLTCSKCGCIEKNNRIGSVMKCRKCGFEINADLNAARNIANLGRSLIGRLNANQPNAPRNEGLTLKWDSGFAERRCECLEQAQLALRGEFHDEFKGL
jgi:putative transposase